MLYSIFRINEIESATIATALTLKVATRELNKIYKRLLKTNEDLSDIKIEKVNDEILVKYNDEILTRFFIGTWHTDGRTEQKYYYDK